MTVSPHEPCDTSHHVTINAACGSLFQEIVNTVVGDGVLKVRDCIATQVSHGCSQLQSLLRTLLQL